MIIKLEKWTKTNVYKTTTYNIKQRDKIWQHKSLKTKQMGLFCLDALYGLVAKGTRIIHGHTHKFYLEGSRFTVGHLTCI